ncbi:hypothetical protein BU26DRAFT_154018 [Trematosphaeria pertusa]|uniref:MYND-type domain-containing protein n=1 Tax=Trematosphaeria pertusa TaxID=390896 RepID=A0A6A6J1K1_9PLEO|nr:uncharacterized protein BU26DRAFT_154018 [Trematosphaeria pertusa]KAF2255333.1 hypothetical protein BU26DRAFT_154018 [Trematosphaeria pertusa]
MDGTADKRCSHCGKTASLKCGHCKASWYCDVSCQKAHWSEHKPACKEADLDRTIHRAGQLLQDVFFLFREQLFDESIESIEDTGDTLFLRDRPRKPGTLIPFPHHLVRDEKEKKMVLSTLVCHEPIGYFHDLFIQMLKGTRTRIEEVTVKVKKPAKRTRAIPVRGELRGDWRTHGVIRVITLDASRSWIIDPAGAQYSMFAACLDEQTYQDRYVEKVFCAMKPGTDKLLYQGFAELKGNCAIVARIEWDGVKAVEDAVQKWERNSGLRLPELLRQPEGTFERHREEVLEAIQSALVRFAAQADYSRDILETEQYERAHPYFSDWEAEQVRVKLFNSRTLYRASG